MGRDHEADSGLSEAPWWRARCWSSGRLPASSAPNNNNSQKLRSAVTVAGILEHQRALQGFADAGGANRLAGAPGYDSSAGLRRGAGPGRPVSNVTLQEFDYDLTFLADFEAPVLAWWAVRTSSPGSRAPGRAVTSGRCSSPRRTASDITAPGVGDRPRPAAGAGAEHEHQRLRGRRLRRRAGRRDHHRSARHVLASRRSSRSPTRRRRGRWSSSTRASRAGPLRSGSTSTVSTSRRSQPPSRPAPRWRTACSRATPA